MCDGMWRGAVRCCTHIRIQKAYRLIRSRRTVYFITSNRISIPVHDYRVNNRKQIVKDRFVIPWYYTKILARKLTNLNSSRTIEPIQTEMWIYYNNSQRKRKRTVGKKRSNKTSREERNVENIYIYICMYVYVYRYFYKCWRETGDADVSMDPERHFTSLRLLWASFTFVICFFILQAHEYYSRRWSHYCEHCCPLVYETGSIHCTSTRVPCVPSLCSARSSLPDAWSHLTFCFSQSYSGHEEPFCGSSRIAKGWSEYTTVYYLFFFCHRLLRTSTNLFI